MENSQDRLVQAEKIVRKYVIGSAGAALIPVPLADLAAVSALQLKLVHSLAVLYSVEFSASRIKALIAALIGGGTPAIHGPKLASVLKLLPGGSALAFASTSGLSAATTYAVGKVFILHFETGGTLLDFDPKAMRNYYAEQLKMPTAAETAAEALTFYAGVKP